MPLKSLAFSAALLTVAALLPGAGYAAADSLYDDLGGDARVTQFVGEMLEIAVKDPRIAQDFDNINLDWLHKRIVLQICSLTGGPCKYTGRDMYAAHKGLHLATLDFNALVEDMQIAMDHADIPFRTQNRLLAILAPMYRDIVTR
ncbi:MAG TPA: group 1 truncated hemoglobin [Stellaceae bacterium]|jgi:hemoglobin|nr:group 1 truncated hemoglobin [Stellaceae bacterium]